MCWHAKFTVRLIINLLLATKESKPRWRDCPPCLSKAAGGLASVASSSSPDDFGRSVIHLGSENVKMDGLAHPVV